METAVTLKFADGEYHFFLPMARICEIERLCGTKDAPKSIEVMFDQMGQSLGVDPASNEPVYIGGGATLFRDVYEVIRAAAIGGGLSPLEAKALVDNYVDGRPLTETVPVAWAILNGAIRGVSLKKKADEPETESLSPFERASSSPTAGS